MSDTTQPPADVRERWQTDSPEWRAKYFDLADRILALLRAPRGERPAGPLDAAEWADLDEAVPLPEPLTDAERAEGLARIRADRMRRTPRGEGDGRADRMPATLAVSQSLSRVVAAMQAAWIEWMHGRGADAAMQWIENTLIGPGLIPGDDESDAQAFFDRAIAEIEEHRRGVEAEIAALAAWIAMEARMAESLGRSKVVIEWRCGVCGHWSPRWSRARCQRCGAVRGYGYRDREAVEERTVITYPTDRSESDDA